MKKIEDMSDQELMAELRKRRPDLVIALKTDVMNVLNEPDYQHSRNRLLGACRG